MKRLTFTLNFIMIFFITTSFAADTSSSKVHVETTEGIFVLELYPEYAPATIENFLNYVDSGFYEGTLFHRVIPRFMAQGGGFDTGMKQKETNAPVKNESLEGLSNERGTIAMARTNDPNSATSQFFINVNDNWNLDAQGNQYGYTVFGKVISGMGTVDIIVNSPTQRVGYYQNVPVKEIKILKMKKLEENTNNGTNAINDKIEQTVPSSPEK